MPRTKYFLPTGIGSYEEISDFPPECIRPQRSDKLTILSGYFDLLYYEYRQQLAIRYAAMSAILVLVAVLFIVLQDHVMATAAVLALAGIANAVQGQRESNRFSKYCRTLERELRHLGVGIERDQLTDNTIESTEWGTLHQYPVSGLGIVRPVNTEKLTVWGDRVFALANDKVYW